MNAPGRRIVQERPLPVTACSAARCHRVMTSLAAGSSAVSADSLTSLAAPARRAAAT
jgi:hypothetical protein